MAKQENINIYTLGIGLSDKSELESVASSDENVFVVQDYSELRQYGYLLRNEIGACKSEHFL